VENLQVRFVLSNRRESQRSPTCGLPSTESGFDRGRDYRGITEHPQLPLYACWHRLARVAEMDEATR